MFAKSWCGIRTRRHIFEYCDVYCLIACRLAQNVECQTLCHLFWTTLYYITQSAVTGFVRTMATRQLVMEGGLSGWPIECRYFRYVAHRGRCHGNHFWLSVYGVHSGTSWQIRIKRPCVTAMRPYVKLLWSLVQNGRHVLLILKDLSRSQIIKVCYKSHDIVETVQGCDDVVQSTNRYGWKTSFWWTWLS